MYFALLLRIVFGPFPLYGVVAFHYGLRVTNVSFTIMLTFNRIISALFIIDFDRMAAIPERHVMICLGVVTFIFTLAHVVQEVVIRRLRGLDHFARMIIFDYLGSGNIVDNDKNTGGTGDLLAFPLLGLLISALLCWALKFGSKQTLIVQYQRSVTESTANGRINMSATVVICLVGLSFVVGSIINTVSIL